MQKLPMLKFIKCKVYYSAERGLKNNVKNKFGQTSHAVYEEDLKNAKLLRKC
jgi:hypothetical protein